MDLVDRLREIGSRIPKQLEHLRTEEATKTALVLPFLSALGYDVFDPTVVIPEFTADVGIKKGEKVDYALMVGGKPALLIECKTATANLDTANFSQLFRYFATSDAQCGVLTNGVVYRFFTDLERENKMDERPFLEFNMLDIQEDLVHELKHFSLGTFDIDHVKSAASELKYTREIKHYLREQMSEPDDEFVRLLAGKVYEGIRTQQVIDQFKNYVTRGFSQFISEELNTRLRPILSENTAVAESVPVNDEDVAPDPDIITTEEEVEGYHIVKSILRQVVDPERVVLRDTKAYCGILLDDNNRKPICRLRFNAASVKYIGTFDGNKNETRHKIEELNDLYKLEQVLLAAVKVYDGTDCERAVET